ncbi:unnamed protein product [Rhodiola kirilowii]
MDPFGNNRIEDVNWLCSLSESELDMLISLKKLVIQRAKVIGNPKLASKIDLKMLRALDIQELMACVSVSSRKRKAERHPIDDEGNDADEKMQSD